MPKRLRIRSTFDPRWLVAFGLGLLLSLAYYGAMIWAGFWVLKTVLGFWGDR